MKKKLTILVLVCWAIAAAIVLLQPIMADVLNTLGFSEATMAPIQWIFGIAVLLGAGIPFTGLAIALSNWNEKVMEQSVLYNPKSQDRKDMRKMKKDKSDLSVIRK